MERNCLEGATRTLRIIETEENTRVTFHHLSSFDLLTFSITFHPYHRWNNVLFVHLLLLFSNAKRSGSFEHSPKNQICRSHNMLLCVCIAEPVNAEMRNISAERAYVKSLNDICALMNMECRQLHVMRKKKRRCHRKRNSPYSPYREWERTLSNAANISKLEMHHSFCVGV